MAEKLSTEGLDKFRNDLKLGAISRAKEFWESWDKLKPKDQCELWLKVMPYVLPRVPEEKPISEDTKARLVLEETHRKATLISGGLPETEDVDYETE